jgi:hypothetical protein
VPGVSLASVPDMIEKAATFKAYSHLLHNLYDTTETISPVAIKYEEEAEKLVASYISQYDATDYDSPYSSRLTPSRQYMGRNKRTTTDDTDYDNIDDTEWDSE